MEKNPLRIVQITDMHLFSDVNKQLLGVNTQESFQHLLDCLHSASIHPDCVVLSGDLSQDGSEASYRRIADMLNPFQVPVYCIPGNHDDAKMMSSVYPTGNISTQRHLVFQHWHCILLDSQQPGAVPGLLSREQLDFLQDCLKQYPEKNAMIFFHHQPIEIDTGWLNPLGLKNADDLWQLLKSFPCVRAVVFGHVHSVFEGEKEGIAFYSTPSTCIQFKKHCVAFALEKLPPGCRILDLYEDGTLKTEVRRADHYIGVFDSHAKGY